MDNMLDEDDEIINAFIDSNHIERIGDPYISLGSTEIALVEGKVNEGKYMVTLENVDILVGSWTMGKCEGKGSMTGKGAENMG